MIPFKPIKRDTDYLFPPSMQDWLPEQHLARFVVEIVEQLDLKAMECVYRGTGSAPFHPALLLSILVYGYATGVFSSRKLENATYDSIAFRYVAADEHPDHDTLNTFRKRFLKEIEALMVQVLLIAHTMGVLKLGNIALDGSKIKANASKHSALSYGHIKQLEQQLKGEVTKLLALADAADNAKIPDGMNLPEEIARREDRLKALAEAKAKLEVRATARYQQEQAEYAAKAAPREALRKAGKKPRGKEPKPPVEGARDKDQINLTDEASRIMKVTSGGFEQCYNGQIAVDMESMLILKTDTVQAANDKQQVEPMLKQIKTLPLELSTPVTLKVDMANDVVAQEAHVLGHPLTLVADTGYYSESNVKLCGEHKIIPLIAVSREAHHPDPMERFTEPSPLVEGATAVEKMRHDLKTKEGRGIYAQRKCTVEPVIGIIKSVLGFRQFLLRGLENVKGELDLVALAWNLKRMFVLAG